MFYDADTDFREMAKTTSFVWKVMVAWPSGLPPLVRIPKLTWSERCLSCPPTVVLAELCSLEAIFKIKWHCIAFTVWWEQISLVPLLEEDC